MLLNMLFKKMRVDYVTNSSSSSFVIFYKEDLEIPDELKYLLKKANSVNEFEQIMEFMEDSYVLTYGLPDDVLVSKYHLNAEQLGLVKAARLDMEEIYDKVLDCLKKKDGCIYFGSYDWNYSSEICEHPFFKEIYRNGELISYEP